jgi:hypothetical protein
VNTVDQANRFEVHQEHGFAVYRLGNERVQLDVVPELGARIISLKNLRSGREWLWHPGNGLKLFRNRPGDDFAASPLAGIDECLPTIAPCRWRGRALPDHGEVWSVPWTVDDAAWEAGILKTFVKLAISPLELAREIGLHENEIHLHYRLRNLGAQDEAYLWALHPLLRFEDEDCLELPDCMRAQLAGGPWLDALPDVVPAGESAKVFLGSVQAGRAAVSNRDTGDSLEFQWNPAENNALGLWLTRGGWHGHHHLAIEPTNATHDALAFASDAGRCGVIPAHGLAMWSVVVRVDS